MSIFNDKYRIVPVPNVTETTTVVDFTYMPQVRKWYSFTWHNVFSEPLWERCYAIDVVEQLKEMEKPFRV